MFQTHFKSSSFTYLTAFHHSVPLYHVQSRVNNNIAVHHPKIQVSFHNGYFLLMTLNLQANATASPCLQTSICISSISLFLSSYRKRSKGVSVSNWLPNIWLLCLFVCSPNRTLLQSTPPFFHK